jgi:hypothetical protein
VRSARGGAKVIGVPWTRIGLAALASGIVSLMTDWLFMGDWLYKRYDKHPEIWRYSGGHGETRAIIWTSLLPFLTCSVLVYACARLHLSSASATLELALAVWLIGPLPLTIANSLFMKLTPAIATAHALGWLVKLTLAGLAVWLFVLSNR